MIEHPEPQEQYAQLNVKVGPPQPKAAGAPPTTVPKPDRRIAVMVCHGMGQQVQYETLDAVVREVRETAQRCGTLAARDDDVGVSLIPNEGSFIARAELNLEAKAQQAPRREVHFYEAYWAPLTEGRVTLSETINFLVDAAQRGVKFAYQDGVFDRWMFGGREEFEIPARRVLQLGLGLWIILLIAAGITATGLLPAMKVLNWLRVGQTGPQMAVTAAVAFSIGIFLAIFGIITIIVASVIGISADVERPKSVIDAPLGIVAPPRSRRVAMALVLVLSIVLSGAVTAAVGMWMYSSWILTAITDSRQHPVGLAVGIVLFAAETLLFRRFIKGFLVEFAGDVAAYVSPYKVSKFEEIRRAIQERGRRIARFVYSAKNPVSGDPLYDEVFVVGHSLGSVIAYDTLNDAINRDTNEDGWSAGSAIDAYRVVERTKLLLTFGSPLDKTAFVFRTQKMEREIDVREALAGAQQPLIVDYKMRCGHWINLWSRSDWVSGPLGYYDGPQPPLGKEVCNIENRGSKIPSTAHTEYWTGPLFRGVLHTAMTGICPDDVLEPQRSQVAAGLR